MLDYRKFAEAAMLVDASRTEKDLEDCEALIKKFQPALIEASNAFGASIISKTLPALFEKAAKHLEAGSEKGVEDFLKCLESIVTSAFMSGYLEAKGILKDIEEFKKEQLRDSHKI